ncbi:PqqD family protein [Nocardioides sp. TRM66260-LWL]|uniref:PqqD family protein n=1 Tax=Nocardioides sp. TRM66260-LWL TaxID=2874478 RepID=UPI001CC69061|nr:PqqD family protein [Nocardioides sp. TRM66260-LWL]MBZ5734969.1 PqqD family protein [Nocardioides sp. TRM66260-LWL]
MPSPSEPSSPALPDVVRRRRGVPETLVRGRRVLLAADDELVSLEGSGARIWELTLAPIAVADMVVALAEEHGLDPDQVRTDVEGFVADLLRRGALEACGAAGAAGASGASAAG